MAGTNSEIHPGSEVLHYPYDHDQQTLTNNGIAAISSKGPLIDEAFSQQDIMLPGINRQTKAPSRPQSKQVVGQRLLGFELGV